MRVLVTGGAGYIGSHIAKALAAAGFTPVVYDDLSTGHAWAVQWGPLEQGDILDGARLRAVMAQHQVQAVIHCAARTEVAESMRDPVRYYRINVEGTRSLLDAMCACGVAPIVFSSSCAIYGAPTKTPIAESAPKQPVSVYGETKLAGEQLMMEYAAAYGLRPACLRYFNAAGADAEAGIGEDHSPETHLIPLVLDVALGRRPAITVLGRDYPTPDGSAIRDYIHVRDLAEVHVLAMQRLMAGEASLVVNLGTGRGVSVLELIAAAENVTGKPIAIVEGPRRAGDSPQLVSDVAYAQALLGWQPRHSDLPSLLRDAWHWHQRHFG